MNKQTRGVQYIMQHPNRVPCHFTWKPAIKMKLSVFICLLLICVKISEYLIILVAHCCWQNV